jgi:hypothetical protein
MPRRPRALLFAALACCAQPASEALAWGDSGHRIVGQLGIETLPAEIPAFLRTSKAVAQIGELAREPDRSKGAGQPHDADLDPGHFLDMDDNGGVMGGPKLAAMPRDKVDYETALRAVGTNSGKAGWLYYNVVEGWQQLVKDFATWRVLKAAEKSTRSGADRRWLKADRELRELIIIRDLGYWAHFVGDGSQPLHMTWHYNGWGNFPNPKGYTQERIHEPFEASFVAYSVPKSLVRSKMYAPETCTPPIQICVVRHLSQTYAKVEPTYQLWGEGAFRNSDARGKEFAAVAVAEGASRLRDYVTAAWRASADASAGYPGVKVKDAEAGKPVPMESLKGK